MVVAGLPATSEEGTTLDSVGVGFVGGGGFAISGEPPPQALVTAMTVVRQTLEIHR